MAQTYAVGMKQILVMVVTMVLLGCGKKAPEQQSKVPDANPPAKPKVELPKATLTPGMKAAKEAHVAGNYREAARLYTVELAAEEAKPAPSWVQLSYLHNELGRALNNVGLYDKALEHFQKSLAIRLKKLGPEHPSVASSYNNIGFVHDSKGEYDKALEYYQKSLVIRLKQLGPEHPNVATSYHNMAFVYKAKKDLAKAKEYWAKAYAICLKKLGSNHPDTKDTKAELDALKE
jgi:tetratricopeptide (TPR) repeat protein